MALQAAGLESGHADAHAVCACNELFLSAVLQNPAVEPLEAEELYHIWMCKAESIPDRETLLQML